MICRWTATAVERAAVPSLRHQQSLHHSPHPQWNSPNLDRNHRLPPQPPHNPPLKPKWSRRPSSTRCRRTEWSSASPSPKAPATSPNSSRSPCRWQWPPPTATKNSTSRNEPNERWRVEVREWYTGIKDTRIHFRCRLPQNVPCLAFPALPPPRLWLSQRCFYVIGIKILLISLCRGSLYGPDFDCVTFLNAIWRLPLLLLEAGRPVA